MLIRMLAQVVVALAMSTSLGALAQSEPLGMVIMHGKGGSPTRRVADLARALEAKGYLVANLEMAWSGSRNYDVPVSRAEEEVAAAVADLRGKGAKKVFVAATARVAGSRCILPASMRSTASLP